MPKNSSYLQDLDMKSILHLYKERRSLKMVWTFDAMMPGKSSENRKINSISAY
jgi:hypothetical protein